MKLIRAVIWTLITLVLLSGIITSSSLILHPHPPKPLAWKTDTPTVWTDLDERSHLMRASRASSAQRSVIASASTDTSLKPTVTPPTNGQKPKSKPPTTTVPVPVTVSEAEPAPEVVEGSAYDICLKAATARKGSKIAPNVARWIDLILKYFPNEVSRTCSVMACESSGNPGAVGPRQPNGTYPHGLMQILSGPFDPEENLKLAASMRANRGWQPWSACL